MYYLSFTMKYLALPLKAAQKKNAQSPETLHSYDVAIANWEKAISDFASLNTRIDTFLIQNTYSSVQSLERKAELLSLKDTMARLLQQLFEDLGNNLDCVSIEQFDEHTTRISQNSQVISSQLLQMGLQIITD